MASKARHGSCFHGAYSLTGKMVNNNVRPWCYEILRIGEAGFLRLGDFCLRKCHWGSGGGREGDLAISRGMNPPCTLNSR